MPYLRHILVLALKPDTDTAEVHQKFLQLKADIPEVLDMEQGPNCSQEGLSENFTYGVAMKFADRPSRETYLSHPKHKAFAGYLLPLCDKVIIMDIHVDE